MQSCRNAETGVVGKCCRDPNYVDPWPTGNLPANYTGGFDEQGFPTFLNIAKVRPPVTKTPVKTSPEPPQIHEQPQPTNVEPLVPDNSDVTPQRVISISTQVPVTPISTPAPFRNPYDSVPSDQDIISVLPQLPNNPCGVRNYVSVRNNLQK